MNDIDYGIDLVLSVMLIVGVYQFYFWCQRHHVATPRELRSALDEWVPYRPGWVWVYSGLYYPLILYLNFVMKSPRQFTHIAVSYLALLCMQMLFFVFLPLNTPAHWRNFNERRGLSERMLGFVQRFDARSNSFPSMHVSVATLTAMHLQPQFGAAGLAFPALIAVSCLFTKQHYLIDLPAGALLGWGMYRLCAPLL